MAYEHYTQPVLSFELWLLRVARSVWLAAIIASIALAIGITGYHLLGDLPLVDATLEASMILGGMGPVATMNNDAVKLFASGYALFSGLILISTMAILLAPWVHRMLHQFHKERRHVNRGGHKRRQSDR